MTTGTDAFAQGRLAFGNNLPMSSCEYPTGSPSRDDWMRGWNEARNASPKGDGPQQGDAHPGMMGDGTEEQNLNQKGDPSARIGEDEVKQAFGNS
jgi:hypothetical protein